MTVEPLVHAAAGRPIAKGLSLAFAAALLLAGCGSGGSPDGAERGGLGDISVSQVAALLPPEAKQAVQSYERDLRSAASAHVAEFGSLPASFADLTSAAALRATAVDMVADGLAQQVPFASRETLEKAANGFLAAAERRIIDQMKAQDAPNQ